MLMCRDIGIILTGKITAKVVVEWLILLFRIPEVPGLNLILEIGYPD
jgi:hypothetical protein